ncbi:MAG: YqaA family protein [Variibacter sp.]
MPIYAGLALSAFLAATLLPLSSEAVLAGLLASGRGHPLALLIVAIVANTAGSAVNWLIGRGIDHFRDRPWFPVSPERYEAATRHFNRWGLWSLLFAWLPFVGDPLTVVAGALEVPFWRFITLVGIGKAARYVAVFLGAAWLLG